jgi:Holliday junction resolvase RusA-like endonuclease
MIRFQVLGRPQPAGSKRAFKHPHTGKIIVTDAAKGSRPWKQEVAATAMLATAGVPLLTGPLMLEMTFYVRRPAGHYRTGKNRHLLRDSAPAYPTTRPDVTKLVRAAEDACTGVVWRDDAQVVTQIARKRYGDPERVEIRVDEVEECRGSTVDGQEPLAA